MNFINKFGDVFELNGSKTSGHFAASCQIRKIMYFLFPFTHSSGPKLAKFKISSPESTKTTPCGPPNTGETASWVLKLLIVGCATPLRIHR